MKGQGQRQKTNQFLQLFLFMQLDVFVHGDFELIVKRLATKDLKRLGITSEIPRKVCSLGTKNAVRVLTGASEI